MAKTRSSRPCDPEPRVGQAAMTPRLRRFSRKADPMLSHCCKMCEAQFPNEQDTCFRDSFACNTSFICFVNAYSERSLLKVSPQRRSVLQLWLLLVRLLQTPGPDVASFLVTFLRWLTGHLFTHPIFVFSLHMRPLFVVGAWTSCQDGIVTRVVHRTPYT